LNLFICFENVTIQIDEFILENEQTDELLTLYRKYQQNTIFYLARYPKGEEKWKEIGEKKCQPNNKWTQIYLHIKKFD